MSGQIIALDHFAGTGWGVACHWLGIREYGVEKMPEAIRTRRAVGFRTIYRDVWSGLFHPRLVPAHGMYIASPPCQTFSVAGRGEGRKALDQVLGLIDSGAWKDPARLLAAAGELGDERTALVLTPLAHIWVHRPELIALEQVPTVLPVWEAIAHVLRGLGYSVWTGNMQAEQYGVPQTRKRAILIARADGIPARPPVPTHSRYYSRDPKRLDEGVLPWVSMAEALGWGMTERPMVTAGNAIGRAEGVGGSDGKAAGGREKGDYQTRDADAPVPTISSGSRSAKIMRSNYGTGGDPAARGEREIDEPSATVTSKIDRNVWTHVERHRGAGMTERNGERRPRPTEEPALTVTGNASGTTPGGFRKVGDGTTERVTVAEAAALQSYPPGFEWCGTKTKQFLQIGNAVPPLMAEAILRELVAPAVAAPALVDVVELSEVAS